MAIVVSGENIVQYDPIPEGQYLAVCYGVVDLGDQYSERFQKWNRKLQLLFELPELEFEKDGVKLPRGISKEYTASLGEKSNLRRDLIGWRGKAFTEEEIKGFDMKKVLGNACMMQIIYGGNGDKKYSNISGIFSVPKGTEKPKPINELIYLDWDSPSFDLTFDRLPDWLQKKIRDSKQWKERMNIQNADFSHIAESIDDDDLPF